MPRSASPRRPLQSRLSALASAALLCAGAQASDLSYLHGLLAATPAGGWVQVNANSFSSAWASVAEGGLPSGSYSNPATVVTAWSSVTWDSVNKQLLLWGGGHANYMGNEMYTWSGSTGLWSRGSLPSRIERYGSSATYFVVDNAAPQSAHTYDNSVFLPVNGMYLTFGGAAFNSGGAFVNEGANGNPVIAGPWAWDPLRADPNKVGGTTGSGYLATTEGGEMWTNLRGRWSGSGPATSQIETATAVRVENGKDVVYVTGDANASGWQNLYRYEVGDIRSGELGRFTQVGVSWYAPSFQSAAAFDTGNNLFIQTSVAGSNYHGLSVWNLGQLPTNGAGQVADCVFAWENDPRSDRCLFDRYVALVDADGNPFEVNVNHGIDYDKATGKLYLWDGENGGTVWVTQAEFGANGALDLVWTVTRLDSRTAAQPGGSFTSAAGDLGVLGKWKYVAELGAFIALDNYSAATGDAGVWLYKPLVVAVPEPGAGAMMLAGLGLFGWLAARRRRA